MTHPDLNVALLLAIDVAVADDEENLQKDPSYVANASARRLHRAETMLASLLGMLRPESSEEQALDKFLNDDSPETDAAASRKRNKHVAGSEHFSRPAPDANR